MTFEQAQETAAFIREKYDKQLQLALVLGSGLGAFADEVKNAVRIPYADIPHFAQSTVQGHAGQLVLGEVEGVHVAVQQGRDHARQSFVGGDQLGVFALESGWLATQRPGAVVA